MRCLTAVFMIGGLLIPAAAAQTTFTVDWQLPAGFPSSPGRYFATRDCLAIPASEMVFVLEGLPDPAAMTSQIVSAPTLWSVLAEDTFMGYDASYELILVRGLPSNPTIVPTGIVQPGGGAFTAANPTTALRERNSLEWQILRHGPAGAGLHTMTLPSGSATGGNGFDAGPAGPDRWLVTGGYDHRTLIVFEGLSGPPSGFTVSTHQIPGTDPLDGFVVTETGTGVAYQFASTTEILLTVVGFAAGAPTFTTHSVTPPAWSSADGGYEVLEAAGDNLICKWWVGYTQQRPCSLVTGIDTTPQVAHTWLETSVPSRPRSVAPDEMITGFPDPQSLTYHWFRGPNPGSRALVVPGVAVEDVVKPNRDTLIVVSAATNWGNDYWITVFTDLDGAATPHPIAVSHYPSALAAGPSVAVMSPGMVVVVTQALSPWPSLTFIGLPTICEVASSTMYGPPLHLSASTGIPSIGNHFEILAWGADPWTSGVWLAVATARGEPTVLPYPPFDSFSTLHLDPAAFLGLIPAPSIGPGLWSADLGLELFPPALTGLELYLQEVCLTGGIFGLGNTLLFIPG